MLQDNYHGIKKQLKLNSDSTFEYYSNFAGIRQEFSNGKWSFFENNFFLLKSKVQDFKRLSIQVDEKSDSVIEGVQLSLFESNGHKIQGTIIFNSNEEYFCGVNYTSNGDTCFFQLGDVQLSTLHVEYYNYKSELYKIKSSSSNCFNIIIDGPSFPFGYLIMKSEEIEFIKSSEIVIFNDTLSKVKP